MEPILHQIINRIKQEEMDHFQSFSKQKFTPKRNHQPIDILPLLADRFFLIAEVKKQSPSRGLIRQNFHPLDIARAYEKGGASAISVVTEKNYFGGDKSFLHSIKQAVHIPVLRKDFIFHPAQVYESYNLGADFILLIAACLSQNQIKELYDLSISLGMQVLLEVHNQEELQRIEPIKAPIIGINNRDLKSFAVNREHAFNLKKLIPGHIHVISESGIQNNCDVMRLRANHFSGALVGESLLKQENLEKAVKELLDG